MQIHKVILKYQYKYQYPLVASGFIGDFVNVTNFDGRSKTTNASSAVIGL